MRMSTVQFGAAVTLVCAALALPSNAGAVDLRDWGRKYDNASERFELLASFNNEAVLDKETQLVWRRSASSATSWVFAVRDPALRAKAANLLEVHVVQLFKEPRLFARGELRQEFIRLAKLSDDAVLAFL